MAGSRDPVATALGTDLIDYVVSELGTDFTNFRNQRDPSGVISNAKWHGVSPVNHSQDARATRSRWPIIA